MKKFVNGMVIWKNYACMMFTGCVCLYGVIAMALGRDSLNLWVLLQMLIISALGTLIQGFAFSPDWIIKNAKYTTRMIIFTIPFLILLTVFALLFHWFPADRMINWIIFIGIFIALTLVLTLCFELAFRITGKRYDGLLGQYKKGKKEQ